MANQTSNEDNLWGRTWLSIKQTKTEKVQALTK